MINRLDVDSIQFQYGSRKILSDIFVNCSTGTITGLLGRNGQGKSTLLNVIFGSMKASFQSIRINDCPISQFGDGKRILVNYLPQFSFVPGGTRVETVFSDYQVDHLGLFDYFPDLSKIQKNKFRELSGGEKRLIEIYIIVKSDSLFTILDEPFSYLMPTQIEVVKQLIKSETIKKGFIVSDHLYEHILEISNHIYLLKDGKTNNVRSIDDLQRLGYLIS